MRKFFLLTSVLACLVLFTQPISSQVVTYQDNWGNHGISVLSQNESTLLINHSLAEFYMEDAGIDGSDAKAIHTPGVFLPNEAGAPDLAGTGRYIAIPKGSTARLRIISSRKELITGVDIAPAPRIPLDTEQGPLHLEKDMKIYGKDAFYPEQPVILSEPSQIRGLDVVMLGITPFQYNPVSKELIVYRDLKVEVVFEGGAGQFGDDRLRSRWFDPVLQGAVLNGASIPQKSWEVDPDAGRTNEYEYLIITPDLPDFLTWANTIKEFRTLQGINTGVVTTTEIGGNTVSAIKNYINNAYTGWATPPVAVLLLGDYSTGSDGIISYLYAHPAGYPDFASDNYFADCTGDNLPDIIFARMTARNASELQVMISKFMDYENNPPADPNFYDHPITALGWQTVRWFQLCSETIGGYFRNVQGKNPVRINEVYIGNPAIDPWSTATNTSTVLNYFGPNGLGYIPATPQELGGFSGGTAGDIVNAINAGSFLLQHRDHGFYDGWGEPAFYTSHISYLTNTGNKLPYIFSINCQTGAFHRSSECFTERFHRHTYGGQNSGALGVLAATEVSYSFVNDTYVWGVMDNMFPDYMPGYSTTFPTDFAMPAFGNAAGKYFLQQSSWPYNYTDKLVTYRLFHHHGDAFMPLYSEVPQALSVAHSSSLAAGATTFTVTANSGASIALTVNGVIIGLAVGTGAPQAISIPAQAGGQTMIVTITKQNYYRYSANVDISGGSVIANFSAGTSTVCQGEGITFTDASYGSPTVFDWSFPGGTPTSWSGQTPPAVYYNTPGTYDVTLSVSDGITYDTELKVGYITVGALAADFTGSPTTVVFGQSVNFTDLSTCNPGAWTWTFEGGNPASYSGQTPPAVYYETPGAYDVTLEVSNASGSSAKYMADYVTVTDIQYCASYGNTSQEWIAAVDINGQSNSSGASAGGYEDFTGIVFNLTPGASYPIALIPGFTSTKFEYWRMWIDYNHDGDFTDADEEVFSAAKKRNTVTGTITIPSGLNITTRMRISMSRSSLPTPCEVFTAGEVEDYTVSITYTPPPPELPVADFIGNPTNLAPGESVQFTDLSTGNPTSYSWSFPGGSPTTSTEPNPVVVYNSLGTFDVTLTVTNSVGQDAEIKTGYILVDNNPAPVYCEPLSLNNSSDGISVVSIGGTTNNTTLGGPGFVFFATPVFNLSPGQSYSVNLSPFNNSNRNFWRIWIDFNGDGDFEDGDETLFAANNKKGSVIGSISIPTYITGSTRMRVSMKTGGSQTSCEDNFSGEVEDYNVSFGGELATFAGETAKLQLQVYPNPASQLLNIHVSGSSGAVKIVIYNAQGMVTRTFFMNDASEEIDLTGFSKGLYFLHATDGSDKTLEKVLVK